MLTVAHSPTSALSLLLGHWLYYTLLCAQMRRYEWYGNIEGRGASNSEKKNSATLNGITSIKDLLLFYHNDSYILSLSHNLGLCGHKAKCKQGPMFAHTNN